MFAGTGGVVGRSNELDVVLARLREPGPSAICVTGPPGIGKTSLVEAAAAEVRTAEPHRVVMTRCWDGPGTPALWPWSQILRQLPDQPNPIETADPALGVGQRFAQFDAIVEVLASAAVERPLLIVIDDIHWADQASLELLRFLIRSPIDSTMRVVVTLRELDARQSRHADLFSEIQREAESVPLEGLDKDSVSELLGGDTSDAVVDDLHSRTGGNPLFLLEVRRSLGDASHELPTTLHLPETVRHAIERNLTLLPEPDRALLRAASIQGTHFDRRVLAAVTQKPTADVAAHLATARGADVIKHVGGHEFRFDHALIRDVLLSELGTDQAMDTHYRTAEALAAVFGRSNPEYLASIAEHLESSGHHATNEERLRAFHEAAAWAGAHVALEDQVRFLRSADVCLCDMETTGSDSRADERLTVLLQLLGVFQQLQQWGEAHDVGMLAASVAREAGDPIRFAEVALGFPPGGESIEIDDITDPEQRPLREEALKMLANDEIDRPDLKARLEAALAISLYWETSTGDRAQSHTLSSLRRQELTESALQNARTLDDDRTLAAALHASIYANWGPENHLSRVVLADELTQVAERLGDENMALHGLVWRVADLLEQGELVRAANEVSSFERRAKASRNRVHVWTASRWRATLAFVAGDLTHLEALAEHSLALATEFLGPEVAFHFYSTTISPLHYLRCELELSIDFVAQMVEELPHVPAWRVGLATAYAESGQLELAERELDAVASNNFALLPRDLNFAPSMMMVALAAKHVRRADVALAVYQVLKPLEGRMAIHGTGYASYGAIDVALGQCAFTAAKRDEARVHLERAIALLDPTGSPYAALARAELGEVLALTEPARAESELRTAANLFEQAGLTTRSRRAKRDADAIASRYRVRLRLDHDSGEDRAGSIEIVRPGHSPRPLAALKGHHVLLELVRRPETAIHVLDLVAMMDGTPRAAPEAPLPTIDEQAKAAYLQRVAELRELLDHADSIGDAEGSARHAAELEVLVGELSAATWSGQITTSGNNNAARARVSIAKLLKRSLENIDEVDAELGAHLRAAVQSGMHCSYSPSADSVEWSIVCD